MNRTVIKYADDETCIMDLTTVQARELLGLLLGLPLLYTPLSEALPPLGVPVLAILHGHQTPIEVWRHKDKPETICSSAGACYPLEQVEGWLGYPEVLR